MDPLFPIMVVYAAEVVTGRLDALVKLGTILAYEVS
jgi:hypothetical protein